MDDSLSFESFLTGARTAAQKAMDDHARGEYDEFALHGGVAFERLAKAVLVSKNPAYLVEMRNGNSDMLLYLCGDLKEKPKNVRTVGAMEAIGRLRSMGVLAKDEQLDTLIALRNGTAHTTVGDEAKTLLPALAANVEALMTHLNQPPHAIWGRWTSAIGAAVNKQRNEIQRDVEIRIKQARHLFDDRFKGLPEGTKEKVLKQPRPSEGMTINPIIMKNGEKFLFMIKWALCPACGGTGAMTLTPVAGAGLDVEMGPDSFECRLCSLKLDSPEEIEASGVDVEKAHLPFAVEFPAPHLPFDLQLGETHTG
ncbi:hypothetical protein NC239_26545 [Streptomyces sp. G3]|uniref:hypothetical protein n=1 Tax=Streptomyces sp. G3 TaxID=690144 RepID=UPI00202F7B53|nr:hypothetical protein [Streptomyces sp. G3]MCM1941762.1 hypothetical protein [Streptomyces sp. G3]